MTDLYDGPAGLDQELDPITFTPSTAGSVYDAGNLARVTGTGSTTTLATSAAADDIIDTAAAHGYVADDVVLFPSLTGGSGLVANRAYYVIAANLGSTTFQVSTTVGGAAVNFTSDITAGTVQKAADYDPYVIRLVGDGVTNLPEGQPRLYAVAEGDLIELSGWVQRVAGTDAKGELRLLSYDADEASETVRLTLTATGGTGSWLELPAEEWQVAAGVAFVRWEARINLSPAGATEEHWFDDIVLAKPESWLGGTTTRIRAEDFIVTTIPGGSITLVSNSAQIVIGSNGAITITTPSGDDIFIQPGSQQLTVYNSYLHMTELAADPAGSANAGRVFFRDNGAGKTQYCVRFPTGAVVVLATEA